MPDKHRDPLVRQQLNSTHTLSTLANDTGLIAAILTAAIQGYHPVLFRGVVCWRGATDGEGPLLYRFADASMSLVELEEMLETVDTRSKAVPSSEQLGRPAMILGTVGPDSHTMWHDNTRLRIPTFREDAGVNTWVYNAGAALSTGSLLDMRGFLLGRWVN